MMTNKARFALLLPLLLLFGCTSLTPADLHVLNRNRAYTKTKFVGLLYKAPSFDTDTDIETIMLHPVKVKMKSILMSTSSKYSAGDSQVRAMETIAGKFAESLETELASAIGQKTNFNLVRPGELVLNRTKTMALTVIVTELDPGDAFARWFIGVGAGATIVQIEGGLRNSSGTVIMTFADKRAHTGNPTLGLNLAALSDEYTLKELRKEFAKAVIRLLKS
ncbi:MAG: DUF4410 domain-containing protein [Planctomycetota bacterium]|jgi:hypothetical protein